MIFIISVGVLYSTTEANHDIKEKKHMKRGIYAGEFVDFQPSLGSVNEPNLLFNRAAPLSTSLQALIPAPLTLPASIQSPISNSLPTVLHTSLAANSHSAAVYSPLSIANQLQISDIHQISGPMPNGFSAPFFPHAPALSNAAAIKNVPFQLHNQFVQNIPSPYGLQIDHQNPTVKYVSEPAPIHTQITSAQLAQAPQFEPRLNFISPAQPFYGY